MNSAAIAGAPYNVAFLPGLCAESPVLQGGDAERGARSSPSFLRIVSQDFFAQDSCKLLPSSAASFLSRSSSSLLIFMCKMSLTIQTPSLRAQRSNLGANDAQGVYGALDSRIRGNDA